MIARIGFRKGQDLPVGEGLKAPITTGQRGAGIAEHVVARQLDLICRQRDTFREVLHDEEVDLGAAAGRVEPWAQTLGLEPRVVRHGLLAQSAKIEREGGPARARLGTRQDVPLRHVREELRPDVVRPLQELPVEIPSQDDRRIVVLGVHPRAQASNLLALRHTVILRSGLDGIVLAGCLQVDRRHQVASTDRSTPTPPRTGRAGAPHSF